MKICPMCKGTNNYGENVKYCYRDGSQLIETPTHKCGHVLSPIDKFCPQCGEKVSVAA